jgi:hypothetical protein
MDCLGALVDAHPGGSERSYRRHDHEACSRRIILNLQSDQATPKGCTTSLGSEFGWLTPTFTAWLQVKLQKAEAPDPPLLANCLFSVFAISNPNFDKYHPMLSNTGTCRRVKTEGPEPYSSALSIQQFSSIFLFPKCE